MVKTPSCETSLGGIIWNWQPAVETRLTSSANVTQRAETGQGAVYCFLSNITYHTHITSDTHQQKKHSWTAARAPFGTVATGAL